MMRKPIQKSAFIISLDMRRVDDTVNPVKVKSHDHPIIVLLRVRDVIEFLCKYTDYKNYCKGDYLRMKECLKDACFMMDITNYDRLKNEILCDGFPEVQRHFETYYTEHCIHVHRVPCGSYKKVLLPEFIE